MAIADVDGDGLIDYNEFVAATMHLSKLEKEELLQQVRPRGLGPRHQLKACVWCTGGRVGRKRADAEGGTSSLPRHDGPPNDMGKQQQDKG